MGLVGMAAAVLGAHKVVLTDHRPRGVVFDADGEPGLSEPSDILLHALRSNIAENESVLNNTCDADVIVAELEFGNEQHVKNLLADHQFDVVLGSDVSLRSKFAHLGAMRLHRISLTLVLRLRRISLTRLHTTKHCTQSCCKRFSC
jgi:hypothetical protein